ncbi:GYDIA family GHMP kinase [Bacteriovoracaceae bacterium]|nr:GYDIA family GHMP kinase [Bacteriovoracaceae bacterium]
MNKNLGAKIKFCGSGKLLLTGEYVVLDGAKALAIPVKFGQSMEVNNQEDRNISWTAFDVGEKEWFQCNLNISDFTLDKGRESIEVSNLQKIFLAIKKMNPSFFEIKSGLKFSTHLDFPRHWGLGTSSTLISMLSKWASVNPFLLLKETFGGSGYDVACAQSKSPIIYQLNDQGQSNWESVAYNPSFKDKLYFVYLGKKQNSRKAITHYRNLQLEKSSIVKEISKITNEILSIESYDDFHSIIDRHEIIMSDCLEMPTVKSTRFKDFKGPIKSLGGWGGDFIMVGSKKEKSWIDSYFKERDCPDVLTYNEMVGEKNG